MPHRLPLFTLPLIVVLLAGCGGTSRPDGFPDLVQPVRVKVHKAGTPLSGITVILHADSPSSHCIVSGDTGPDGVAAIQTMLGKYIRPGAPAGRYRVQLKETVKVDIAPLSMDATPAQEAVWQKEYNAKLAAVCKIPAKLHGAATTPLELDVATPPVAVEFDVDAY